MVKSSYFQLVAAETDWNQTVQSVLNWSWAKRTNWSQPKLQTLLFNFFVACTLIHTPLAFMLPFCKIPNQEPAWKKFTEGHVFHPPNFFSQEMFLYLGDHKPHPIKWFLETSSQDLIGTYHIYSFKIGVDRWRRGQVSAQEPTVEKTAGLECMYNVIVNFVKLLI